MFLEATKLGGVSANCHVAPASTAGFRAVNASHTASVCVPSRVPNELRFAAAMSMRILIGCMVLLLMTSHTWAQDKSAPSPMKSSSLLTDFQVIEFPRYTIRDGEREHFAQYHLKAISRKRFNNWGPSQSASSWSAGTIPDSRGYVLFTTWMIAPR